MMQRRKSPLRRKSAEIETEGQVMAAIEVVADPAAARTQVQVAALGTPDLKIEIEAVAVLPD